MFATYFDGHSFPIISCQTPSLEELYYYNPDETNVLAQLDEVLTNKEHSILCHQGQIWCTANI